MEERRRTWWAVIILDRYKPAIKTVPQLSANERGSLVAVGSISRFSPSVEADPKMSLPGPTSCWVCSPYSFSDDSC